ncbi:hypothetical protein ABPG74_004392 [Tetrahymena malaccensis]
MQVEQPVAVNLGSFEISQIIKTSQSQNGLKHSDFQRYRKYCGHKVYKLRKLMKFSHEKKYQKKQIHIERLNDPKMLQVLLFKIENNWAYAMDLKQIMQDSKDGAARKQHHVNKKMAKALKWAQLLNNICRERTDERSYQESEAYLNFIKGIYHHERHQWEDALESYIKSRSIYLGLISVSDSLQSVFFKEKVEFLEQSIRYCHQQNNGFILDTIDVIIAKMGTKMDIEKTPTSKVTQSEKKDQLIEVEYLGSKYPIKNQKAIYSYRQVEDCQKRIHELQRKTSKTNTQEEQDSILAIYSEAFNSFDECIKVIQKEKSDEKNSEAENLIYTNILSFLNLNKQKFVLDRNIILIKNAVQQFDKEDGVNNLEALTTKKAFKLKLIRPTEIIKLCDNLLQVFKQIIEVERQNTNLENYRKLDVLEFHFKAIRCYYVSCVYLANQKYIETLSLLKVAENIVSNSSKKFADMRENFVEDYVEESEILMKKIKYLEIKAKLGLVENTTEEETVITEKLADSNLDGKVTNKTIQSLMKEQEQGNKLNIGINRLNSIPIFALPPKPLLAGCKPIQFDLVDEYINYPKIEVQQTKQQAGFLNKFKFW